MNRFRILIPTLVFLSLSCHAQERVWQNASGKKVTGRLASIDQEFVVLEIKGKPYKIQISELSGQDRQYLEEWRKEKEAREPLTVSVPLPPKPKTITNLPPVPNTLYHKLSRMNDDIEIESFDIPYGTDFILFWLIKPD